MSKTTAWGLGLTTLALGTGLTAFGAIVAANDLSFRSEGVETFATITNSWATATKSSVGQHSRYEFTVDSKMYSGTGGAHSQGEKIAVQYLASDPGANREASSRSVALPLLAFVCGILLVLVGRALMRRK